MVTCEGHGLTSRTDVLRHDPAKGRPAWQYERRLPATLGMAVSSTSSHTHKLGRVVPAAPTLTLVAPCEEQPAAAAVGCCGLGACVLGPRIILSLFPRSAFGLLWRLLLLLTGLCDFT